MEEAAETLASAACRDRTRASGAAVALLRARLLHARGEDPAHIRDHIAVVRSSGGPWPLLKCLRLLVDDGDATSSELEEARLIKVRLGLQVLDGGP